MALSSGTFAGGTTSVNAANGVATFSALKITNAGNLTITASDTSRSGVSTATTNSINVSPAGEFKLAVTSQPVGVTAGGTISLGVSVEDQFGNVVTTGTGSSDVVGLTLNTGSFNGGTTSATASSGVATFSNLVINKAGSYTITAANTTHTAVTSVTSASFTVSPSTASQLVFTTQPTGTTGGLNFPTQPAVTVEDQFNNVVTTNASTATLAIASGTPTSGGPGTLSGCTQSETNGVITFSGCSIDDTGANYKLKATDGSLTAATSNSFTITTGPLAQFAVSTPSSPSAGTAFTVTLTAQDAGGNTVTSFTGAKCFVFTGLSNSPTNVAPIYPSKGTGTTCSTGTSLVTFAGGLATGGNAPSIKPAAAEATSLTATSGGFSGTSANFTVSAGSATVMTATSGAAQAADVSSSFSNPLVATVTDADGNPITNTLVTFTSPASSDGTFASSGCVSNSPTTVCTVDTDGNGQATSSTFTAGTNSGSYTVTATAPGSLSTTFGETNRMTATSVATNTGTSGGSVTTNTFNMTSGHTYVITAFEASNQTTAPSTPTLTISGSPSSVPLVTTNTFSSGANCADAKWCDQWVWWFNATTSSGTVRVAFNGGTPPIGSAVNVIALAGNNTSTPVVSGSTTTASGCGKGGTGGCTNKTSTVTANTANAPATDDITMQILASDDAMGSAPIWSPATTNLFFVSGATASLDVNVAIPGVRNESTSASPFVNNDDWGTIALELESN